MKKAKFFILLLAAFGMVACGGGGGGDASSSNPGPSASGSEPKTSASSSQSDKPSSSSSSSATSVIKTYTVKWVNYDGTELEKDVNVEEGSTPSYDGETPTKPSDAGNNYTFTGWDPEPVTVTADATYTAQYSSAVREYEITFVVDGVETKTNVAYGETPSYEGTPTKESSESTVYTFDHWEPEIAEVTGEATYTAVFSEVARSYTVTFVVDGTEYPTTVAYGETPQFDGSPAKDDDDLYSYVFTGWDSEIVPVTGDATYTAVFEKTTRLSFFDWELNGDGITINGLKVREYPKILEIEEMILPTVIGDHTVTEIGSQAFNYGAYEGKKYFAFKVIVLPVYLVRIDERAFINLSTLESIVIPDSVTSIGKNAFQMCTSLATVVLGTGITTISEHCFSNTAITKIVIPEGVTSIGYWAFGNCSKLETVILPATLTLISDDAFYNCMFILVIINHSELVLTPGSTANGGIAKSATIIAASEEEILEEDVDGFHTLAIDGGRKLLKSYSGLGGDLVIPEGITDIAMRCFYEVPLKSLTLPSTIKAIGREAFYGCGLRVIELPDGIESIEYMAFGLNDIVNFALPESVTYLGNYICQSNYRLTKMVDYSGLITSSDVGKTKIISNSQGNTQYNSFYVYQKSFAENYVPAYIDDDGFVYGSDNCTQLIAYWGDAVDLVIPDTVTTLSRYCLYNADTVVTLYAPNVDTVMPYAMCYMDRLLSVRYANSPTIYSDWDYGSPMIVENLKNGAASTLKRDDNGFITLNAGKTIVSYIGEETTVVLDDKVTEISKYAFRGLPLVSITLPAGLTTIGNNAFEGCDLLTSITLPANLETIGKSVFFESGLTAIHIPAKVSSIGEYAFKNCVELASVTIEDGEVGLTLCGGVFINCVKITEIDLKRFVHSYSGEFSGCTNLSSVTLYEGLKQIGPGFFQNCTSLRSVTLPDSVETLGSDVFAYTPVTHIDVPANASHIAMNFLEYSNIETYTHSDYPGVYLPKGDNHYYAFYDTGVKRADHETTNIDLTFHPDCEIVAEISWMGLTSAVFHDKIRLIGSMTFDNRGWYSGYPVPKLSKVYIGTGVTKLPFAFLAGLTQIRKLHWTANVVDADLDVLRGVSSSSYKLFFKGTSSQWSAFYQHLNNGIYKGTTYSCVKSASPKYYSETETGSNYWKYDAETGFPEGW